MIVEAPRDDKDRAVMEELPMAISGIGGGEATAAILDAAIAKAKGKRKKALELARGWVR